MAITPTSCCRRCDSSSADTWKSRRSRSGCAVVGPKAGEQDMTMEVLADADAAAARAAAIIAQDARAAVAARGRFTMAVSGGHTPWVMLRALAKDCLLYTSDAADEE